MQGKVRQGTRGAAAGDVQRDVARLLSKRGDADALRALAKELIVGLRGTAAARKKRGATRPRP